MLTRDTSRTCIHLCLRHGSAKGSVSYAMIIILYSRTGELARSRARPNDSRGRPIPAIILRVRGDCSGPVVIRGRRRGISGGRKGGGGGGAVGQGGSGVVVLGRCDTEIDISREPGTGGIFVVIVRRGRESVVGEARLRGWRIGKTETGRGVRRVSDAAFGDEGRHRGASAIMTEVVIVECGENRRELYFCMIVVVLDGGGVPIIFQSFWLWRFSRGDGAFLWAGLVSAISVGGGGGGGGGHAACGVV